jgi:hypothetical protein
MREVAESVAAPLPARHDFPKPETAGEALFATGPNPHQRRLVAIAILVVKWIDGQGRQVLSNSNLRGRARTSEISMSSLLALGVSGDSAARLSPLDCLQRAARC